MKSIAQKSYPVDLALSLHVGAGDTYEWSKILLARARLDGTLELLTAAWAGALGYGREELKRKTLGDLMGSGDPAVTAAAILDERNMAPIELALLCRDGRGKGFTLHRRHDEYGQEVYIVAEETTAPVGVT